MYSAARLPPLEERAVASDKRKTLIQVPTKKKKGETEVSPELDNFVDHEIQSPNPRAKGHNLPMLKKGLKQKEIAELIGVSLSTISREIKRNATKRGKYNDKYAQLLSNENIACSAKNKSTPSWIKGLALKKLIEEQWPPKQIVGWMKREKGFSSLTKQSTSGFERTNEREESSIRTVGTSRRNENRASMLPPQEYQRG